MSRDESAPPLALRIASRLPGLLAIAVAVVLWRLFFPALMSADTMNQYGQALTGRYLDWHPPFMAAVLNLVLRLGGTVGLFMLLQCLAGVFGVRALAAACLAQLYGPRLPPRRAGWLALLALLVLLLPVTPLAFYLMTLWKDVWAMVLLLWLAAVLLRLTGREPQRERWPGELLLVLALAVALGLVRHNAVLVLPVAGWILWSWRSRVDRRGALVLLVAPLAAWLASDVLLTRALHVQATKIERVVMALDLLGVCAADATACDQLPFTRSHVLDPGYASRYPIVDAVVLFHGEPRIVDPGFYALASYDRLRSEYTRAARSFPWLLAKVKLAAFVRLLGVERTSYFIHDTIVDNPYGFVLDRRFAGARERLSTLTRGVAGSGWRWLSGVHLVWLVANVAWIAALLVRYRRSGEARWRALAQVLLLPLAYSLSYLPAAPAADFRFLFPATLVVQCVTVAALLGGLAQKPRGREP
ncbi:MAG TPA: hypothetical protein VIA62_13115 [Thermoanaerobaculia bacterium]|jgi:hypothetical protein|nr:hypothetical protein [Thermoanaerobaculia bacterium]